MSHRVTTFVIRSGQPRAYADTEHVVQIKFEQIPWNSKDKVTFEPWNLGEEHAREYAAGLKCGYTTVDKKNRPDHWATYVDYFKPIDPVTAADVIEGGDPKFVMASVWEFKTVSPYTD